MLSITRFLLISACAGILWDGSAAASVMPSPQGGGAPKKSLMDLGRDFARRIGNNLNEADLYLSGAGKVQLAEHKAQTQLPDDEPLLLHGILGAAKVGLQQDIYGIKRHDKLLISFNDFCNATGLAIKVSAADAKAAGWFISTDRAFSLDAAKRIVTFGGKTVAVAKDDISAEGSDILVSTDALEQWFGLSFDYNFANLTVTIATADILPAEAAYLRGKRKSAGSFSDALPRLPFQGKEYGLLTRPYIDTNITARANSAPDRQTTRSATWSTVMSGDVAGLNTQAFVSGTDQDPYLSSARITMGKQDVNGKLLGPLHATSYEIGDVGTVSQPLIGGGAQEQGVSISSKPLFTTTETFTQIRGNIQPGWDVELYRNDVYLDIQHVDSTGLYNFENVDLVEGDNDFKLVFYGPQGDMKEEHRHIGVNPAAVRNRTGNYSVSMTRNGIATWDSMQADYPGRGAPHIAAEYEYGVPWLGTISMGARGNSDNGTYRGLAQAGLASYFYGTFLNANIGIDPQKQALAGILTARRNFSRQSLLMQYVYNSPSYSPSSATFGANLQQSWRTNLSGPLGRQFLFFDRPNYNLGATYSDLYSGAKSINLNSGLSASIDRTLLYGSMQYNLDEAADGDTNERASGSLGLRGFALGGTWRLGADYSILPVEKLIEGEAEYYHPIGQTVDASAKVSFTPDPDVTTGSLGLNWRTSKATISPSVQYDTNKNMQALVNVHFAMGADPFVHDYRMYNKYLSSAGGVAALIYLDANGDGVYNQGDELMPDVKINAVQEHRTAMSDSKGIAFIPDLEQNRLTDVIVDPSTFKDSYNISLFEGVSIRPHPGSVAKLEFPVVVAGEMDGQADVTDAKGVKQAAHNLTVSLVSPDGKVEKTAVSAFDGYWSLSTIRPGFYYLTVQADDAMPGYMLPRPIVFTPGGSTYFGQAVSLTSGHAIPFRFRSTNTPPSGPNRTRVIRPADVVSQQAFVELGPFHSRLATGFAWYRLKLQGMGGQFSLMNPLSKITPDPATGQYALTLKTDKAMTMAEAAKACQTLESIRLACAVQVVSTYIDAAPKAPPTIPIVAVKKDDDEDAQPQEKQASIAAADAQPVKKEEMATRTPPSAQIVVMNLGSYNSRLLMSVMWYKLKTRYAQAIGDAHVLVKPSDSIASPATGKHMLLAAFPQATMEEAGRRCALLRAQAQTCTAETVSSGHQMLSSAGTEPKG